MAFLLYPRLNPVASVATEPLAVDRIVDGDILVTYVYDGDTIRLANGDKVRLIGIDTPETSRNKKLSKDAKRSGVDENTIMQLGHIASENTKELLMGRKVRLEFDIEKRDKYGRLLAYVFRSEDGLFINEAIIKDGYAYPMTIPPNIRYADHFKKLFREAREAGVGLWASEDGPGRAD